MRRIKSLALATLFIALASSSAMATFSGQIWIPSTDVKGFKEVNISIDNYARFSNKADAFANYYDVGATVGILPFEKFKIEVGVDYYTDNIPESLASTHPAYFNGKCGIPEDAFFTGMPAIAGGMFGYNTASKALSTNVAYGLIAKTLPVVGRFSAGGYYGDKDVLVDKNLNKDNSGFLASWDRTMSEISDKLWLAVDYQSGKNALGAASVGASWAFSKQVSLLIGANFYNETKTGGRPTFTTQLDINLP